jgi:hypothetical protein
VFILDSKDSVVVSCGIAETFQDEGYQKRTRDGRRFGPVWSTQSLYGDKPGVSIASQNTIVYVAIFAIALITITVAIGTVYKVTHYYAENISVLLPRQFLYEL